MRKATYPKHDQYYLFGQEKEQPPSEKKLTEMAKRDLQVELRIGTVTYPEWSKKFRKMAKENENLPAAIKGRFEYAALVKELAGTVDFYSVRALEKVERLGGYKGQEKLCRLLSNVNPNGAGLGWTGKEISNASGSLLKDVFDHGVGEERREAGIVRTYCAIIFHACTMLALLDGLMVKDAMYLYHDRIEKREKSARSSEFMKQDDALHNAVKSFMAACLIPQQC